jgi:predicted hydrocarbon binding protein
MLRKQLGDFSSVVCLKAIMTGMEDALGEKATAIALTAAGRTRGKKLIEELGLSGSKLAWYEVADKLNYAFGENGTRLCIVDKIEPVGKAIAAYTRETVCSAGELPNSERKCTYTLGAIWGALEQVSGKRLRGKQTESVLRGGNHDVFEFTEIS